MVIGNYQEVKLKTTPEKQNKRKLKLTKKSKGIIFVFLTHFQKERRIFFSLNPP